MTMRSAPKVTAGALDEAVRRLVQTLQPERIYLFGSRARGDATEASDYDLMVVVPGPDEAAPERQQTARQVLFGLLSPVDLLVWPSDRFERQLPVVASFPATIVREGRLLYGNEHFPRATSRTEAMAEWNNGGSVEDQAENRRLTWEWIAKAEQELQGAERSNQPPALPGIVAYHCQQAMEKALKGFLLWRDEPFRKTHELKELVQQCAAVDATFIQLEATAAELGPYAVQFRYSGSDAEPTPALAARALHLALDAVDFVKMRLPQVDRT
ncbi:MAG: HEPN domain-containing protein [Dehalococcoidia bacterium]